MNYTIKKARVNAGFFRVISWLRNITKLHKIEDSFLISLESSYNIHYNHNVMSNTLKITTVGSSAGIVLPKSILERLRVEKGDTLYAIETPNGIELTPYDPEFAEEMEIAEKVMRDNRDLLRKLAE